MDRYDLQANQTECLLCIIREAPHLGNLNHFFAEIWGYLEVTPLCQTVGRRFRCTTAYRSLVTGEVRRHMVHSDTSTSTCPSTSYSYSYEWSVHGHSYNYEDV